MPLKKDDLPSTLQRSLELKDEYGPPDPQAAQSGRAALENPRETYGGIDAGKTREELLEDAREAGIEGRSKMDKAELARALEKHSRRETDRARG